jgi:hypothetical protein
LESSILVSLLRMTWLSACGLAVSPHADSAAFRREQNFAELPLQEDSPAVANTPTEH